MSVVRPAERAVGVKMGVLVMAAVLMAGVSGLGKWAQPTIRLADIEQRQPLSNVFPERIGQWVADRKSTSVPLPPDVAAQIAAIYTEVGERTYLGPDGQRMMVTVAYGRDQSDGFKVHRPEVCYAAQGFTVSDPVMSQLDLGGRSIPVVRVDTHKEPRFEPVSYWMVIGDTVVGTAMTHKVHQIRYALHGLIADGLLVRVSSLSQDPAAAYAEQDAFIREWMKEVPANQRSRLFGK
ncbi:MAG: EpsI family protein [Aquabacterium sp.]